MVNVCIAAEPNLVLQSVSEIASVT
jgi:hypothetical protein